VVLTNCSNNNGPWQFPEKLIPLYGDGANVRDWLYVEDHVDALLLAACRGIPGRAYCVGGSGLNGTASERTNKQVAEAICGHLDQLCPAGTPHARLITPVADRPGHDRRYAIDPTRISTELGWQHRHSFESGLEATVRWYLENLDWCAAVREQGGYAGGRLGVLASNPSPTAMCSAFKRSCLAVSGIVIWRNSQETKEITITMSCRSK